MTESLTEFRADMTESLTEFRADMTESLTEFRIDMTERLTEFRADMAEIKETTRQQAEVATKLVGIVETLIQEKT